MLALLHWRSNYAIISTHIMLLIRLLHLTSKADRGVKHVKCQDSNNNHHALKRNKQILLPNQRSIPPLRQLRNSIHRSPENANRSQCQCRKKSLERGGSSQGDEHGVLVHGGSAELAVARVCAPCEIEGQADKGEEGHDLEGQARDHDVVAELGIFACVGFGGGDAAAGGLEEEGDDVAGDKL